MGGTRILFAVASATLIVFLSVGPTAEAGCSSLVRMSTGAYVNYVQPLGWPASGTTSDPAGLGQGHKGLFWQPGRRGSQSSGTYGPDQWWIRFTAAYGWYFAANMTDPGVSGCPGGPLAWGGDESAPSELITCVFDVDSELEGNGNSNAHYYCSRQAFDITLGVQYDQSPSHPGETWGPGNLVPIPRPTIVSVGSIGPGMFIADLTLDDVAPGFQSGTGSDPYATITGYKICRAEAVDHPPRDASFWDCSGPTIPTQTGGVTVQGYEATCVQGPLTDIYLATRLEIDHGDANQGYDTEYLSRATVIECDRIFAEPKLPGTRERDVRQPAVRSR